MNLWWFVALYEIVIVITSDVASNQQLQFSNENHDNAETTTNPESPLVNHGKSNSKFGLFTPPVEFNGGTATVSTKKKIKKSTVSDDNRVKVETETGPAQVTTDTSMNIISAIPSMNIITKYPPKVKMTDDVSYSKNIFIAHVRLYEDQPGSRAKRYAEYPIAQQIENHKPIFTKCSKYKPTVKEEELVGTYVFTVHAEDPDPKDAGGTVTYKLLENPGDKQKFSLDPVSGEIHTNDVFDHDEPSREKEAFITVRVSDNGRPQLDDACTIKIIIEDINDNQPVFDKVAYSESVPQDLLPGFEVMRMSATDIDDGINSIVHYSLDSESTDHTYFYIDPDNGVIFLNRTIDKSPGYRFKLSAIVTDMGVKPLQSSITLNIDVIESNKKSPSFVEVPQGPIVLKESYNDYHTPIATIKAVSNIPEQTKLHYELVQGQTEQTNKQTTFVLELKDDRAVIRLSGNLDYERITEYTLTVRIQNNYRLATETKIEIKIEDVNDNIPKFAKIDTVTVPENEPPGTQVIQVQAFDADATYPFNHITYVMDDASDPFTVDPVTGNVTTLKTFDREERAFYNVLVLAVDEGESALTPPNSNRGQLLIAIEIADRNDNAPRFTQETYVAESIAENANINELVTIVQAKDPDTASVITYSIVNGNTYDAFVIKNVTGEIRVNNVLDYENITTYSLDVKAFDGLYEDYAKVIINIENINDNPPVFIANYTNTIDEETIVEGCVVTVEAYDPDIKDRSQPQRIQYSLVKTEQQDLMEVDSNGCITLKKPLDRDPPNGFARWQILVMASDNMGKSPADSLRSTTEVILILNDINDNAPELAMNQPVRWMENEPPGLITKLTATDRDTPENGPPFTYTLASSASADLRSKFEIRGDDLYALVRFDREQQKFYSIPILITDSGRPPMSNVSQLIVEIGDKNDNPMESGSSEIFVYNYLGLAPELIIGTVYVQDPDDWDVGDKTFELDPDTPLNISKYFEVKKKGGKVVMKMGVPEGTYNFTVIVTEEKLPKIPKHTKPAYVIVYVKYIPEVAVDRSGSMRIIDMTAAKFIERQIDGLSLSNRLTSMLANIFGAKEDNVDIFSIHEGVIDNNQPYIDIRYAVHGSPYYYKEMLDSKASLFRETMENTLDIKILMTGVNECVYKTCSTACASHLDVRQEPVLFFTNKTSFVGVFSKSVADCDCYPPIESFCYNGGTPYMENKCECPPGYGGDRCELTAVGFNGDGFGMYTSPVTCEEGRFILWVTAHCLNCLIFYYGPNKRNSRLPVEDFIAMELRAGYLTVMVSYGSGVTQINMTSAFLANGETHQIEMVTSKKNGVEIHIDKCLKSNCVGLGEIRPPHAYLSVMGHMYVGGVDFDLDEVADTFNWTDRPTTKGLVGCVNNFTVNGVYVNLGQPVSSRNADATCSHSMYTAVSFGINTNFLIVIIVCIIILIVLLLGVVVHRKKSDEWAEKEMDDIRENIIAYEDEGGGEGDAGYNLHVLRQMFEAPPEGDAFMQHPAAAPNISGFLDDKKTVMDRDPEFNPYDDVRHYAYEGDGNSSGTLSSLASCFNKWRMKRALVASDEIEMGQVGNANREERQPDIPFPHYRPSRTSHRPRTVQYVPSGVPMNPGYALRFSRVISNRPLYTIAEEETPNVELDIETVNPNEIVHNIDAEIANDTGDEEGNPNNSLHPNNSRSANGNENPDDAGDDNNENPTDIEDPNDAEIAQAFEFFYSPNTLDQPDDYNLEQVEIEENIASITAGTSSAHQIKFQCPQFQYFVIYDDDDARSTKLHSPPPPTAKPLRGILKKPAPPRDEQEVPSSPDPEVDVEAVLDSIRQQAKEHNIKPEFRY